MHGLFMWGYPFYCLSIFMFYIFGKSPMFSRMEYKYSSLTGNWAKILILPCLLIVFLLLLYIPYLFLILTFAASLSVLYDITHIRN